MKNQLCQCGKIVCQLENDTIQIKCRHCKRLIIILTKGIIGITFK